MSRHRFCALTSVFCLALGLTSGDVHANGSLVSNWDGGVGNWSDANWNTGNNHISGSNTFIDNGQGATSSTVALDVDSVIVNDLTIDVGDTLTNADGAFMLQIRGTHTANVNGTLQAQGSGNSLGIQREDGSTGDAQLINNSPIEAINGATLTITRGGDFSDGSFSVTNNGLVQALNGGRFELADNINLTNLVANTLTGGTWVVNDQGGAATTIHFGGGGSTVSTNAADITLSGPNAVWQNVTNLSANTGTFNILGGHDYNSSGFVNTGNVVIDALSSIDVTESTYVQAAGSTTVNGQLSGSPGVTLTGGTLGGTGTIIGPLNVTGGALTPGASPGVMNITGDFNQGAGGTTTFEIGGPTPGTGAGFHDQIVATGNADIDGIINFILFGGFLPPAGTSTYDVLTASSITLQPGLTTNFPTVAGTTFSAAIINSSGGQILRLTANNSIPEPATLTLMMLGGAMMLRRRKRSA